MIPLRVLALAFLVAAPAAARTSLPADSDRNGNPDTMTCMGMMDVAALSRADAKKKAAAQSQIVLAHAELKGGRETSCKSHMKLALQALDQAPRPR